VYICSKRRCHCSLYLNYRSALASENGNELYEKLENALIVKDSLMNSLSETGIEKLLKFWTS